MESTDKQGSSTMRKVAVALLTGFVVFVLLFQWGGGIDPDPPTCFGMFGLWTVPCGGWPAVAAGALTAGVVWLVLWWWDRRRFPASALADAPVSPQDIEVDTSTDDGGEHPDEDVTGAEEPSGHKGDREPRDNERAEGYPDSASDLGHESTPQLQRSWSFHRIVCVGG